MSKLSNLEKAGLLALAEKLVSRSFFELFTTEFNIYDDKAAVNKHFSEMRMNLERAAWLLASNLGMKADPSFQIPMRGIDTVKDEIAERLILGGRACLAVVSRAENDGAVIRFKVLADDLAGAVLEFERNLADAERMLVKRVTGGECKA